MIKMKISADTAEELRQSLIVLIGWVKEPAPEVDAIPVVMMTARNVPAGLPEIKEPEKAPATRTRAKAEKTSPEPAPQELPVASNPLETPASNNDPLASTPAPSTDPLGSPGVQSSDPLSNSAPAAKADGKITLELLRAKIAPVAQNNKQAIKDIIAQYLNAAGQPCERPSDVQEKDYEAVYNAIDFI